MTTTVPNRELTAETPLARWLEDAWAQEAEVRTVEVEDACVRYRGWGLADADKPGLVFVHGFLAHARWWDHIAPHFTDRYRVIAPDLSGMGDSGRRKVYSRQQYARELIAVTRDAGIDEATFVAHSFGSGCALYAAVLDPSLINRVIVIDGRVFRPRDSSPIPPIKPETFYASFEEAVTRYRLTPPGLWPVPEIMAYFARHSVRDAGDGRWGWKFDPALFGGVSREVVGDIVSGLTTPTDLIHAAQSEVLSDDDLLLFRQNLPGAGEITTIPLAHHHIMIEQPVALVSTIKALLSRAP